MILLQALPAQPQLVEISFNPFLDYLILVCAGILFMGMVQISKLYRKKRKAHRKAKAPSTPELEKEILS